MCLTADYSQVGSQSEEGFVKIEMFWDLFVILGKLT